ncbi:AraC family transcriptional regulator [Mesorhizobium sp. CGMCC 1.15528]|uniref:AraC family transcriptional regulator n=1 Tax=Mesorhizobium zhangyense TaxID=1776730 RepID=A0A7C9R3S3_9HYPH|nr:helix-turn-helix domain-containing protein [Mesorhizobium zhangyense]NGN39457.1 AraC family transcriptional regulator [Mesorhizobium zhangyense]
MSELSETRSILAAPQAGAFEMVQHAPDAALTGLVTRITGYRELVAGHFRQTEAASLTVPLIISFGGAFSIGLGRTPGFEDRVTSFAAGLFAGPVVIDSFGDAHCIQIDFTPLGARRFFGMPMTELTGRMIDLGDVMGREGRNLRERLSDVATWDQRLAMAQRFVTRRLAGAARAPSPVSWAFDRLMASGGRMPISRLATEIGWSRKHLANRFAAEIGIGPKTLSRIVRFNHVLTLSKSSQGDGWAGIAAECGYADQAHMARDFHELAGTTPAAWLAQAA